MKKYISALQQFGVGEEALVKFFRGQGPPEKGVKRFVPILFRVERKADNDNVHRFIISTPDEDRDSDILVSDGVRLGHYMKNPVVLWAHDYWGLPIGRSLAVKPSAKSVKADVEYAPTDFAQQVRLLVATGFLKGSSVGFNPITWEVRQDQARVDQWGYAYPGYKYTEWELLEWSIVAVPCNPFALLEDAKAKGLRVDVIERMMKANTPKTGLTVPVNLTKQKCNEDEEEEKKEEEEGKEEEKDKPIMGEDGKCRDRDGNVVPCPDPEEKEEKEEEEEEEEEEEYGEKKTIEKPRLGESFSEHEGGTRKTGAVLNAANKARIKQARDLLQEVLDDAEKPETVLDDETGRPAPEVTRSIELNEGFAPMGKDSGRLKQIVHAQMENRPTSTSKLLTDREGLVNLIRDTLRAEVNRLKGRTTSD